MISEPLSLTIEGGRLDVVPAVHFRLPFAEEVNRLCHQERTRPAAIAVELGPSSAMASSNWLKELCASREAQFQHLPCMLALARPNHRIRASARDRAIALQRATGRNLHELPPRVLRETLGYSSLQAIYLSPTDSIIEAMRCACELNLPLYGVDLEQSADARRTNSLIEDPARASERVPGYTHRNARYAAFQRDEEVDGRREIVMAARLKTLIAQHKHVLFTGGLAHWTELERMLRDPGLHPAPVNSPSATDTGDYERVIVHPLLAIYHLDVFPALANAYEDRRDNIFKKRRYGEAEPADPGLIFSHLIRKTYQDHFSAAGTALDEQLDRRLEDFAARADFEHLVDRLCLLNQTLVPDIFTALLAAKGTMSPKYCECLAKTLMEFDWAVPQDFPKLPVLAPAPAEPGDRLRGELLEPDSRGGQRWRRGQWVYVDAKFGGGEQHVQVNIPWEWEPARKEVGTDKQDRSHIYSWPPTSRLVTAMSFRSMQVAEARRQRRLTSLFEGSMQEGLDLKATLRAQCQGNDQFYVRELRHQRKEAKSQADQWDPVIWVFRTSGENGIWDFQGEPLEEYISLKYADDPKRMAQVAQLKGSSMVQQVGFGRRCKPADLPEAYGVPPSLRQSKDIQFTLELQGVLLYTPPHFHGMDNAAWVENGNYERAPICSYSSLSFDGFFPKPVLKMFRTVHHLELDLDDWPVTMVRMAIPYARHVVTVIAPDHFRLPDSVYKEATRQGKEIRTAPQSWFPREALRRMAIWHAICALPGTDGRKFDSEFDRVFGEPITANQNLLSNYWLNYGTQSRQSARYE